MSPRAVGLLIGAAFGLVFVLLNADPPVPEIVGWVLRGLAVLAFLVLLVLLVRGRGPQAGGGVAMFGRGYRFVVLGEVLALVLGILLLRLLGTPAPTPLAWTAFVVGVHFGALALVWRERSVLAPGFGLTLLGALGLVLCATPAVSWVPLVSGVLSGFVLLGGSLWAATRGAA